MVPSGSSTSKKPRPLIATSSAPPVWPRLPWANSLEVAATRTPVPTCSPVGRLVCSEVAPPGWRVVWYSRSSKLARSRLKPVVLVLARLLEMTAMRVCCASRPVLAIHRAWVMAGFRQWRWARSARGQQGVGRAGGFVTALQDPYLHLELARQLDHRDQHPGGVDVAAFAHARGQ